MINDPYIAAALIGFMFGVFVGVNVAYIVFRFSRMRKLMDEFEKDRARFRAEFERARERMTP